ncbi:MAG: hypothetical protein R2761_12545 [Acidimicrobiales bacterium]
MDRRRLVWITVFVSALVAVIGLAWAFAVPSGNSAAAPRGDATAQAGDGAPGDGGPAGPALTADNADASTTTYDPYTTLPRPPDTGADSPPVPLAATSALPRPTPTADPAAVTSTTSLASCVDPASNDTARCVTTTAPEPGATFDICDTSVGRTTDPGCPGGGTAYPTTASTAADPCAAMTTLGCPGATTTTTAPVATTLAPPTATTAPPTTCYPVACSPTTRAAP